MPDVTNIMNIYIYIYMYIYIYLSKHFYENFVTVFDKSDI